MEGKKEIHTDRHAPIASVATSQFQDPRLSPEVRFVSARSSASSPSVLMGFLWIPPYRDVQIGFSSAKVPLVVHSCVNHGIQGPSPLSIIQLMI